jgi:hypothetical protein
MGDHKTEKVGVEESIFYDYSMMMKMRMSETNPAAPIIRSFLVVLSMVEDGRWRLYESVLESSIRKTLAETDRRFISVDRLLGNVSVVLYHPELEPIT